MIRACLPCPGSAPRLYAGGNSDFVAAVGLSRTNGIVELAMLEHFVREDLNTRASAGKWNVSFGQ
jgi:hypothetical protein